MDTFPRITINSEVMGGRPCIRGMRVTVAMVLRLLATGHDEAGILREYPYLESADLREVLAYAAWQADETETPLPVR